jgi:excinuclease UvrABC nuclease subunit
MNPYQISGMICDIYLSKYLKIMATWELKWTGLKRLTEEIIQTLESVPGVYRLSYKSPDTNIYVFYVGKCENIKEQLTKHISAEQEKNVCVKNYIQTLECYFRFALISNEEVRSAGQRQLYKHYQPSCNERMPEGDDNITINVT